MATNFPTSIDSFTNPSSGDTLDSPSHAAQHANVNDAVEAVQTLLKTGSVTMGEWQTWTPTLYNFTVSGYGAEYCRINDIVFCYFASNNVTAVTGTIELSLPVTADSGINTSAEIGAMGGTSFAYDGSLTDPHWGRPDTTNSGTRVRFWNLVTTSIDLWDATSPFTWASGDDLRFAIWYKAA